MIFKYMTPIGMLLGGTILTIASSYQNKQTIDGQKYFHPFIQTFCYFLGESFCYLFYLFKFQKNKSSVTKQTNHHQTSPSSLSILPNFALFPAILDGIAMTLQYSSLTLISPSVYQILRGGVIIVTAILSVTVLKKKLNLLNIIGLLVVLIGIVIVGAANLAFGINQSKNVDENENDQILGYGLIIISLFANGLLFIQEEKIIKANPQMKPLDLVGFEGAWGVIYYSGLLLLLNFIPCRGRFCVLESSDLLTGTVESIPVFFNQLASNSSLILSQIIVLITIGFYAFSAVSVTRNLSAMVRSLIDVTRCFFVWIVGILITTNSDQQWESLNPIGIILQTIGFLFIVVGSLIYNQILFKRGKQGNSAITKEFNLSLLDKSDIDHEGYHKVADHDKQKHHNKHHSKHKDIQDKKEEKKLLQNNYLSSTAEEDSI